MVLPATPTPPTRRTGAGKKLMADKHFTDHEMATITILADIIIPDDEKSGSALTKCPSLSNLS